jgi:Ca-activated chloride channel family protein
MRELLQPGIVPSPLAPRLRAFLTVSAIFGLYAAAAAAAHAQFSTRIHLVEVYATVTDRGGPVTDLTQADFTVREDGVPQTISAFASGDVPLALAVGIDRSFSMPAARIERVTSAVGEFLMSLRAEDQVMLLAIGSGIETVLPLSTDRTEAAAALRRVDRWGETPLYDATIAAIDAIEPAAGRRALVLLSDGDDRGSRVSATAAVEYARRKDVLVYPVSVGRARPPLFAELAAVTGGRSFATPDGAGLPQVLETIARELRSQYLIGYTPARPLESGEAWRAIQVSVARDGATVRAREGYVPRP